MGGGGDTYTMRLSQSRRCTSNSCFRGLLTQFLHCFQRLSIAKEFGDKSAERRAYSNLGNAHIFLGEFDVAADQYKYGFFEQILFYVLVDKPQRNSFGRDAHVESAVIGLPHAGCVVFSFVNEFLASLGRTV